MSGVAICDECGTEVKYLVSPPKGPRTRKNWTAMVVVGALAVASFIGVVLASMSWQDANVDAPPGEVSSDASFIGSLFGDGTTAFLFIAFVVLIIVFGAVSVRSAGVAKHPEDRSIGHSVNEVAAEAP